jgi:Mrp family chromosome partitioning ATPase
VWNAERAAGGAEWSPFVRRRQRIDQRTRDRRTTRLLAHPRDHKLTAPALGIALDGDLTSWRQGRYVVPPAHLRGKAMAVVGAPGAGKTVTLLRLAYLAGVAGRKVCFADCKGTDPTPGARLDRRLSAGPSRRPGRLLARAGHGHVARHPRPGPEPPAGH